MKKMLHKGFNPSKCKTSLKMASSRVKLLRNKKGIQLTQLKREVAQLLQTGQDQTARIRVEHVVREEKTITAYELIDLYCELIVARLPIIETQKHCPIDLKEAIASIIFASPRCSDIPELTDIRKHFTAKYGKEFVTAAVELRPDSGVSRSMIEKLSAVAPDGPTKVKILTGIAEENNIKWEPDWFKDNVPDPPAYVPPNAPYTDKISQMNVEPQTVQASPRFEPKPDIPSNNHHVPEPDNSKFVHSSAGPSDTVTETAKSNQHYSGEESSSFGARQKWNMEFKDASAAAQAAAESAEMASMAARAAAEIANRDRPNSSRPQRVLADPKRSVKASARRDENSFKKESYHAAEHDRPNSSQQPESPAKAVQEDEIQPNTGKRSSSEFIPYADHKESFRYDEEQYDKEVKVHHDSSPEDSEFRRSTSTDTNRRHDVDDIVDDSVENPLYEETWETRNQPKSYLSQPSGLSESYGSMPVSDPPKFDDDLYEDPFDTNRRDIFFKEDLEREESYEYQKDDVHEQRNYPSDSHKNLFSEGGDYSIHEEKGSSAIDDSPHFDAPHFDSPHFDDDGADEDDYIQSPGRKSPKYSSSDEERSPKKFGMLSSRHLYQPELSESFKNSTIFSQLDKPISLGDDSDGATSESDEEVQKSKYHERTSAEVVRSPYGRRGPSSIISEESIVEHRSEEMLEEDSISKNPGYGTRSRSDAKSSDRSFRSRLLEEAERLSSPRRSSLQAIPDSIDDFEDEYQSSVASSIDLNVESLSGGLKNKGLRLPPYTKGTSPYSSSSSILTVDDAPKVTSDDEIKEILGKRESIRKKKNSSLQGTYFDPKGDDPLDDFQDEYKSSMESSIDLNVESLSGRLKHKIPSYTKGPSSYSSSSSKLPVDDAPKVTSDDEIKEILGKRESIRKKKNLSLQGTDFDPKDDYPLVNADVKSLPGGLRLPPYTKGTSSSSSVLTVDDAPKVTSDDEIKEILGKRESIRKKKNLSLQGAYFDPKGDDSLVDDDGKDSVSISNLSQKKFADNFDERSTSSGEESGKQTVPSRYQPVAGVSRRTRASGQSRAQTETRSSYYRTSFDTESVTGNGTSSAKPKTRPEPRSNLSSEEQILSPSVAAKRATSSQTETRSSYDTGNNTSSAKPKTRPEPRSKMSSEEEISSPSFAAKRATSSQTETRTAYKTDTESVTGKDKSSAKPKTRSGIQVESSEPRRREESRTTRPSHLSKMSSGEEISSPSASVRRATSSQTEPRSSSKTPSSSTSYPAETETPAKPKPKPVIQMQSLESSSPPVAVKQDTQKALSRESSDKKASHVHPKLPDWDDFTSHFRKNPQ